MAAVPRPVAGRDGDRSDPELLRIHLLGGFRAWVGERAVPAEAWRRRKVASLVKLLCLAPGHRLHREQIQDRLWPELDGGVAANNLHRTLYLARRTLEPALLGSKPSAYLHIDGDVVLLRSDGPLAIDVEEFEVAAAAALQSSSIALWEAAIERYTGDLLPDEPYEPYEDWFAGRRETLRATFLRLLTGIAALHEAAGDRVRATERLERVLAIDRADEAAHIALMRLYAASGQRAQALRQYQQLRAALRDELDASPSAAAERLHADIVAGRSQDLALAPPAGGAPVESPAPRERAGHARREGDARHAPDGGRDGREGHERQPRGDLVRHYAPPKSRLPVPATRFIGREDELAAARRLLLEDGVRLLTLVGPGGVGKTRLAIELAARLRDAFEDAVYYVSLAPLAESALVWPTVCETMGVVPAASRSPGELLQSALGERRALLVLDNFEHVLDAARGLPPLLSACPPVQMIATSRAPLHVGGERQFPVQPFSIPAGHGEAGMTLEGHQPGDALRLFAERAQDVSPDFRLTVENTPVVAEICRSVDGLPLAIELAAARTKVLTPPALLLRLKTAARLPLLAGGPRDAPGRQQTLRRTMEWSCGLLAADEQTVFRHLAVFAGSFTLEAATAVAGGQPSFAGNGTSTGENATQEPAPAVRELSAERSDQTTLELVSSLVDQCLIQRYPHGDHHDEPRFTMLETIREFALEQLFAAGEAEAARCRHATYFVALAERGIPAMHGPQQGEWYDRFERDLDNLRAVQRWVLDQGDLDAAARLAHALRWFWEVRGYASEALAWLEAYLASQPGHATLVEAPRRQRWAQLLAAAAHMAHHQGNLATALTYAHEAARLYRSAGCDRGVADALLFSGIASVPLGDDDGAWAALEESRTIWVALGEPWGEAQALEYLGKLARDGAVPDPDGARPLYEAALAIRRRLGDRRGIAQTLQSLGNLFLNEGDYKRSAACSEESLATARALRDSRRIAISLLALSWLDQEPGNPARDRGQGADLQAIADGMRTGTMQESAHNMLDPFLAFAEFRLAQMARDFGRAERLARQRLVEHHRNGDQAVAAFYLLWLAVLAAEQQRLDRAACLLGASQAVSDRAGVSRVPLARDRDFERKIDRRIDTLHAQWGGQAGFDQAGFDSWFATGRAMSLDEAVDYALGRDGAPPSAPPA